MEYHGIDALCVWLQRLQARGGASGRRGPFGGGSGSSSSAAPMTAALSARLDAMEQLLLCLWKLMNSEVGMRHMLTAEGAGVLALESHAAEPVRGPSVVDNGERHQCNLFFLARGIDPALACLDEISGDPALGAQVARVQCIAIKLLTSAAAYSPLGHARALAAVRHIDQQLLSTGGSSGGGGGGGGGSSSYSSYSSSSSGAQPSSAVGRRHYRFFRRLAEARTTTDEVLRCAMVFLDALLDPKTLDEPSARVELANGLELARVMKIVTRRCRSEFASADHVSAINAHVELILEGIWRDNELAAEEMGAVLVAAPQGSSPSPNVKGGPAMPTDPLPPPPSMVPGQSWAVAGASWLAAVSEPAAQQLAFGSRGSRNGSGSSLRQEVQALRQINHALMSRLEDLEQEARAFRTQRDALLLTTGEALPGHGRGADAAVPQQQQVTVRPSHFAAPEVGAPAKRSREALAPQPPTAPRGDDEKASREHGRADAGLLGRAHSVLSKAWGGDAAAGDARPATAAATEQRGVWHQQPEVRAASAAAAPRSPPRAPTWAVAPPPAHRRRRHRRPA